MQPTPEATSQFETQLILRIYIDVPTAVRILADPAPVLELSHHVKKNFKLVPGSISTYDVDNLQTALGKHLVETAINHTHQLIQST